MSEYDIGLDGTITLPRGSLHSFGSDDEKRVLLVFFFFSFLVVFPVPFFGLHNVRVHGGNAPFQDRE